MKKIIFKIGKILSYLIPYKKGQIAILDRGGSGSNVKPLFERLNTSSNELVNVRLIDEKNISISKSKLEKFKRYWIVYRSEIILSTHGFPRLRQDNLYINTWHGVPLKAMGLMNESPDKPEHLDDYFISTSPFYDTLINSCFGLKKANYIQTGYPRNDYLFTSDGRKIIESIFPNLSNKKLILYTPTFRDDSTDVDFINSLSEKELEKLDIYCKRESIRIVVKMHPFSMNKTNRLREYSSFILLNDINLENKNYDLYEVLNAFDILITDYSSIYIDFLLLNKPIIFTSYDLNKYTETRGLLLYPYDFWTPGAKVRTIDELIHSIADSYLNDSYSESRENFKNIFHKYQDSNSTDRVIELIKTRINKR